MDIKDALKYLEEYSEDKLEEIDQEIEDLQDQIADLEMRRDEIMNIAETDPQYKEAMKLLREAQDEVSRVETAMQDGLYKVSPRLKEQLQQSKQMLHIL